MIKEHYNLWANEEYTYPVLGNFCPTITSYIHEDDSIRAAIVITPGGGYCMVSPTEGEIIALEFFNKGYNTFVVTYSTNLLMDTPLKLQALKDLSKAVVFVRKNADKFKVNPQKVAICGFSAGGHLCGSLAVHHDAEELICEGEYKGIDNRPNAVILSYPVITSGEYAHRDSFINLLGLDASEEELEYMSLEKHVTKDTPPTFLWHTKTDGLVTVDNSYLFANACRENDVDFELHVFSEGHHGMSLANEAWAAGDFDGYYCMEQFFEMVRYLIENEKELPSPFNTMGKIPKETDIKALFRQEEKKYRKEHPDKSIAIWPDLVHNWLEKLFN